MTRTSGRSLNQLRFATVGLLLALSACSGGETASENADGPTAELQSALGSSSAPEGACDAAATAGAGWLDTFIPESTDVFTAQFRAFVSAAGNPSPPTIDGVIGFSDGPASAFTDLGPIVRFAPSGDIDARSGGAYVGSFPYHFGDGPYEFQLRVDLGAHNYTVWVRHLDSPDKPFEILGQDLAFRTEQGGVARLDSMGRFIDSAQGSLQTCGFGYASPSACAQSGAGSWQSRAFPARGGQVRLEYYAWVNTSSIDAVIGPSNGAPTAFSSLAAAVRFRPDGTLDARNGSTYAADASFSYSAGSYYQIAMDIDVPHRTYSVSVAPWGQAFVSLAHDYAFRTEQAAVTTLDHLGQYVDGDSGFVSACALTVVY